MKGGHFVVLRFIETFNRQDPEELKRVRACQRELAAMGMDHGFIPYKTPPWAVRELFSKRIDAGFNRTFARIRALLDPNQVLNPGKWETGQA
jgi:hypothetical protein